MTMTHVRYLAAALGLLLFSPAGGKPACAQTLNADSLKLDDYRGSVVYLDFWASWCVPCRKSFPWMNAMHAKYRDSGLVIIAVNVDRDHDAAEKFLKKYSANFIVVYDPKGKLAEAYHLEAMPTSFLIARDGTVVGEYSGFHEDDVEQMDASIKALLSQGTEKPDESADPEQ